MRLRQAVLHPSLVLKRLSENIAAAGKAGPQGAVEVQAQRDAKALQRLLLAYNQGTLSETMDEKAIDGIFGSQAVDAADDEESFATQTKDGGTDESGMMLPCIVCMDTLESPVMLPDCQHVGCKPCLLAHFIDCDERAVERRCPTCSSGPLTEDEILQIEKGVSKGGKMIVVKASTKSKKDKRQTSLRQSSSSSAASTSRTTRQASGPKAAAKAPVSDVITIDDSSDDDDSAAIEATNGDQKGKQRASSRSSRSSTVQSSPSVRSSLKHSDDEFKAAHANAQDSDESGNDDDDASSTTGVAGQKTLDDRSFRSSTKLDALVDSLQDAKSRDPNLKAVVFSQFTGFIDIIERILQQEHFKSVSTDSPVTMTEG